MPMPLASLFPTCLYDLSIPELASRSHQIGLFDLQGNPLPDLASQLAEIQTTPRLLAQIEHPQGSLPFHSPTWVTLQSTPGQSPVAQQSSSSLHYEIVGKYFQLVPNRQFLSMLCLPEWPLRSYRYRLLRPSEKPELYIHL